MVFVHTWQLIHIGESGPTPRVPTTNNYIANVKQLYS